MSQPEAASAPVFDPYSEDYWNGAYGTYKRLRDEAPIYHNEARNFWALSRYEDVHEGLRDFTTFKSGSGIVLTQLNTPGFDSERDFPGFIIGTDPPTHTELRGLVKRSFSPRAIEQLESAVRKSVQTHMARIAEMDEFDLCKDFADRVPADVMYDLMGVPEADRDMVFQYNEDFNDVGEPSAEQVAPTERHLNGQMNMVGYVIELAERKRANPEDDLITEIIGKAIQRPDGTSSPLGPFEIGGLLLTILGAGVETTTKMMAAGVVAFHRNPAQWQKILDDSDKIPGAIEEIGRYDPPLHLMGRRSTTDVTLHGVTVPAGSNFLMLIGAANRDDRAYEDPDRFDIERVITKAPLTFGFGAHLCLGAALARMEMRVAIEEIRLNWPKFEIDESALVRARNPNTAGFSSVPMSVR